MAYLLITINVFTAFIVFWDDDYYVWHLFQILKKLRRLETYQKQINCNSTDEDRKKKKTNRNGDLQRRQFLRRPYYFHLLDLY